jgi:hypothetical protein
MDPTPRNNMTELPVHDILDGSELMVLFDLNIERIWREENIVNILGIPLGSEFFVASYLQEKGLKHDLLLPFIKDVSAARFPREAEHMLKGAAIPRLSHILVSVQKGKHIVGWMTEIYGAHLSVWLHCLAASDDLEQALGPEGREGLSVLMDLPASYGGAGLHSLEASTDEELLGSFAGIAAALIALCRKTELPVYIRTAEAVEMLENPVAG